MAYRIRHEHRRDLLAWHALSTAAYEAGTTFRQVVGREPLPLDPRWPVTGEDDDEANDPDWQEWEREELAQHAAAGFATMGVLTPEEYARAKAEAHVR